MANGSAILLFLSYYADLSSTLSVIRYQLSIFHCPLLFHTLRLHSRRGCVTATPLLLILFKNLLRHFQNTDSVGTVPKEAAYAATGLNLDNGSMTLMDDCQIM
jgi:hypothetical protein